MTAKLWIAASLALFALAVGAVVMLGGARVGAGPEPIVHGRDGCDRCRMRISAAGFGGELRDADGKLTKYDDVGCLLVAMWKEHREVPEAWVEDHAGTGWVALTQATFVIDSAVQTPMGYGVLAFRDEAAARAHAQRTGGRVGQLEDVLRDKERFQRGSPQAEVHR